MCGLVGFCATTNASDNEIALLKSLLAVDIIRGAHATGLAKIDPVKNEVGIHKRAVDAYDFLADPETKEFLDKGRARIYMGHNRYATMGDKTDHGNAHPFQVDHITMVHNGTVDTWGLHLLDGNDKYNVDSNMLCATIANHGAKKTFEEKFSGAAAVVWWDSKERSLNFIRNEDRPLFMAVTTTGTIVWASEPGMLKVFLERPNAKIRLRSPIAELKAEVLVTIPFTEAGVRKGAEPQTTPVTFLDLPIPESERQTAAWWSRYVGVSDYDDYSRSQGSQAGTKGSQAGSSYGTSGDAYARNTLRINNNLDAAGSTFKHRQLVTFDVVKVEAYANGSEYGTVTGIEREENLLIEAHGINVAKVHGYTVLRGSISNAYFIGQDRDLKVTVEDLAVSCLDPKHRPTPGETTPVLRIGTISSETKSHSKPRVQVGGTLGNTPPANISYPLKVQGHTFNNVHVFRDFVSQGCASCGKIPTAYDQRNRHLTVYEGAKFTGSLDECEFICGECVIENK
ncbi:L-glutamine-D-fructose-6-phosphate-aminotransferase [Pseudomonas phage FJK]|nr:L-glutamine-D-fructose-6-phosphate-aminotransferase [Pseudomonas phage FJK]